jgi:hydrogenase maturation protein HypF
MGHTGVVSQRIRTLVRVEGIVQGVGFRPFVYSLATGLGLGGVVGNDVDGVFAEVEGAPEAVGEFMLALRRDAPPLASIERIATSPLHPDGSTVFSIAPSQPGGSRRTLVSADIATCDDCLAELDDPAGRRFGYPFINCTNCGPRFTIVTGVPYDRALTTMAGFAMCTPCAREYHDPADRRFHAQPTCCPDCGPRLLLTTSTGAALPVDPITGAAEVLAGGGVLAVKGLGGYHLAADAMSEPAAAALRARKHREDKPFAVMVAGLDQARLLCEVDEAAGALLTSRRRPIVLLPRLTGAGLPPQVAPGNRYLGVMLPYTPLHHLLLRSAARPIVLTSGNVSDEPIVYADDEARARLGGIADAFLSHDRAIHIRTDDSVVRPFRGRPSLIRRARGYAPEPLRVRTSFARPVLACGAELKSTFCLAARGRAFVSQHIGDLENVETLRSFAAGIEHFSRLFDIAPAVIAHDLHPDYLSTRYARDRAEADGLDLVGVQHHHAHIASCLADNHADAADARVIGVAFDGTGYGTDGTIWGGEFLIAGLAGFERAGHLTPVPMPGGAAAIRQPWRMAAAYLDAAGAGGPGAPVRQRHERQWDTVLAIARRGINSPATSSAGRLFDAVAAVLGVRDSVSYEGQAAAELEQLADPAEDGAYQARIDQGDVLQVAGADLVRRVAGDLAAGVDRAVIAARFHNGLAGVIADCCLLLRERTGLTTVALSGGVFQNFRLLNTVSGRLESHGCTVLTHSRVPCNDGGISLGQAVIAAAQAERGSR